jgi:iron complex outermembrane recepter protein
MWFRLSKILISLMSFILISLPISAEHTSDDDLSELTMLMDMEIVSSSKFKQSISEVAAAIYVITADDISASGALNLPSLLRQVPGLDVSQVTSSSWAISIRGFNSGFSNKLLVMVDGRSVYSPLFSGVYWSAMDMDLNTIERIEVIRGAGSTTWGANAVNGVINIITKEALNNEDESISLTLSNQGNLTSLYTGFSVGDNIHSTANFSYRDWKGIEFQDSINDEWQNKSVLSRWEYIDGADHVKLTFDLSEQNIADPLLIPVDKSVLANQVKHSNHFVSLDWSHVIKPGVDLVVHADLGESKRESELYAFDDDLKNLALDFKVDFEHHDLTFGAGYRKHAIGLTNNQGFFQTVGDVYNGDLVITSFYLNDAWQISNNFQLQFGVKVEDHHHLFAHGNNYDESEFLPNIRMIYNLGENTTIWSSWNKSARTPSLAEHLLMVDTALIPAFSEANPSPWPVQIISSANHEYGSEVNEIIELGYRTNFSNNDLFDVVIYHSDYDNLRTTLPQQPYCEGTGLPPPQCQFPNDEIITLFLFTNGASATMKGIETTYKYHFSTNNLLTLNWTYQHFNLEKDNQFYGVEDSYNIYPEHKLDIIYQTQLNDHWRLYSQLNYLVLSDKKALEAKPMSRTRTSLAINLYYQWSTQTSISLGLENLLSDQEHHYFSEFFQGQSGLIDKQINLSLKHQW